MNASKLFAAIAIIAFTGTVSAQSATVANAAVTAAAAQQLSGAAYSLNIPVVLVNKSAGRTRAEVRAEAVAAVKHHRATDVGQFDWIN